MYTNIWLLFLLILNTVTLLLLQLIPFIIFLFIVLFIYLLFYYTRKREIARMCDNTYIDTFLLIEAIKNLKKYKYLK